MEFLSDYLNHLKENNKIDLSFVSIDLKKLAIYSDYDLIFIDEAQNLSGKQIYYLNLLKKICYSIGDHQEHTAHFL